MIKIKNLSKIFHGEKVLSNIDCSVKQGEIIALIGPSGSGKSTLLRCINFLETPDSGTIEIDGVTVTPDNANLMRQKVGMVFQSFNLFPHMTALENITYAPINALGKSITEATKLAHELLGKVGLAKKANAYPHSLSGGQKQRVAIARTLAMEPEVMLFDEPTSALDIEMVKEVLGVIKLLSKTGITMMIVTHEIAFARELADRIIFLDHGHILEDMSPSKFFKNPKSKRAKEFVANVVGAV